MGAMPRAPSSPRASAKAQATAAQAKDIDAQLASADRHCLDHGLKLTSGRKAVLQALLRRGGTAKAYELLADLQSGGASVAPMAVYRSLDFLVAHDIVHKVASNSSFVYCQHDHHRHHEPSFLICERCGSATEWDAEGCHAVVAQALKATGFAVHGIEIQGLCAGCAQTDKLTTPATRGNR